MTTSDLKIMQQWSLERKINVSLTRIQEWYYRFNGKVYVSFSGGKDSTVLLDLVRRTFPEVPAVYIQTGMEYPDVLDFIKGIENVQYIKPVRYIKKLKQYQSITFKDVLKEYGFCYPYKDAAYTIYYAQKGSKWAINKMNGLDKNGNYSEYNQRYIKYKDLIDSPFKISHKCCEVMKELPSKIFERQSGLKPMVALLADESSRRLQAWLRTGCNAFDVQRPISKPLSFWTEQDILEYLYVTGIDYASVYGKIYKTDNNKYCTSGLKRTGCVFCPIGSCNNKINNYQILKRMAPKLYAYCLADEKDGGLGMKEFLDYFHIPY